MIIWGLELEPLEMRYTTQHAKWIKEGMCNSFMQYFPIKGEILTESIEVGEFLDVLGTNYWKASQLQRVISYIENKTIIKGDILFLFDIWNPAVISLAYIRDAMGIDLKFVGMCHDGTYDEWDFTTRCGMEAWGEAFENSIFWIMDKIFVGSHYHKELICKKRCVNPDKIIVTSWPFFQEDPLGTPTKKENIVIFPHRLNPDKAPEKFDELERKYKKSNWKFIKTQNLGLSKKDYYELLNKSKIAVSFSKLECFGISMREAVLAGCLPLVPNRLAYSETFPTLFQYKGIDDFYEKIDLFMNSDGFYQTVLENLKKKILEKGKKAIPYMIKEILNIE